MPKQIHKIGKINWLNFLRYNFCSPQIKRDKGCYLIPYRNAVIDLSKNCKVYIKGNNIHLGTHKLRGSHTETFLRMEGNSIWNSNNGATICYGSTIELKNGSVLTTGYMFMNTGSVIICSKKIEVGNDVWIGRDNTIYDNDHHQLLDKNGNVKNKIQEVLIGDNVWITNHVSILKGVKVGNGVVIGPYSVIRKNISDFQMVGSNNKIFIFSEDICWSPELVK